MRAIDGVEKQIVHVMQGEHHVSDDPNVVLVTILGSCVSACLRDPQAGLGGMNHFLLPGDVDAKRSSEAMREAVHAMELLVNALLVRGAARDRLQAKIFGGGGRMSGLADVGSQNAGFAIAFLKRENIDIVAQCLGGQSGRRIQYWPVSGRARRSFIDYTKTNETRQAPTPVVSPAAGLLELF